MKMSAQSSKLNHHCLSHLMRVHDVFLRCLPKIITGFHDFSDDFNKSKISNKGHGISIFHCFITACYYVVLSVVLQTRSLTRYCYFYFFFLSRACTGIGETFEKMLKHLTRLICQCIFFTASS